MPLLGSKQLLMRIGLTVFFLAVSRIGYFITLPGLDKHISVLTPGTCLGTTSSLSTSKNTLAWSGTADSVGVPG